MVFSCPYWLRISCPPDVRSQRWARVLEWSADHARQPGSMAFVSGIRDVDDLQFIHSMTFQGTRVLIFEFMVQHRWLAEELDWLMASPEHYRRPGLKAVLESHLDGQVEAGAAA